MRLSPLGMSAIIWSIIPFPDNGRSWVWSSRWNEWKGKSKYSEKPSFSIALSTTNPTCCDLGSKPDRHSGKPATKLQVLFTWPPLWSSGHSSWLQVQRSEFDSRRYKIFGEVVGLERGPLSLVSATEELLQRKNISSGLENRDYGRKDPPHWRRDKKVGTNLATSACHSVGIVRSRTKATELLLFRCDLPWHNVPLDGEKSKRRFVAYGLLLLLLFRSGMLKGAESVSLGRHWE
jgi:hypothetical protein